MPDIKRPAIYFLVNESLCTGCLNCQLICSITYADKFNPGSAYLDINRKEGETESIIFKDDCTICGLCAGYCLYGALIFKKEN